jgi:hypothetical protein
MQIIAVDVSFCLGEHRAGLGMMTTNKCEHLHNSAIQRIRSPAYHVMQRGSTGLHCVRCNSSNSNNSSIDCARIERLQDTHFDSKKNTSFCTIGFRMKSESSNSILQSFDKPLNNEAKARWLCVRYLLRLAGTNATGLPNHGEQTSFLCPRFCSD